MNFFHKSQRAPRGWRTIDTVPEGAIVVAPTNGKVRQKAFSGAMKKAMAYSQHRKIFVRYEQFWFDFPELQAHERTHIRQEQYWGEEILNEMYEYCNQMVGYRNNPFEVEARMEEEKISTRLSRPARKARKKV